MSEVTVWFLDVAHGDSAVVWLPNGSRFMIDCGCGPNHWPSTVLKHFGVTKTGNYRISIPDDVRTYGLDELVITHPHGDHLADIKNIRDEIGFFRLVGGYGPFIGQLSADQVDFRKRGQEAAKVFFEVVKSYNGQYEISKDAIVRNRPVCVVEKKRFIGFTPGMDLNELSWFVSVAIGGHKILFTGDMTATGVRRILQSNRVQEFKQFVAGTTILKIPHHGRDNGCSQEMFDLFGNKPLACIASDEMLNDRNEGTSNIAWYSTRTSDQLVAVDGTWQSRKVFTTRSDKDIELKISDTGVVGFRTKVFADLRRKVEDERGAKLVEGIMRMRF